MIATSLKMKDRAGIIEAAVHHLRLYTCKAELDQIAEGLETFQFIQPSSKATMKLFYLPVLTFAFPSPIFATPIK